MIFNIISPIIITIEKMAEDEKKDKRIYRYLYYNNFTTKKKDLLEHLVVTLQSSLLQHSYFICLNLTNCTEFD